MKLSYLLKSIILGHILLIAPSVTSLAFGQIKTSVTFSNPYVKQAKRVYQTEKEFRRDVKDSLRLVKKLNKHFDYKIDSLSRDIEKEFVLRNSLPEIGIDSVKNLQFDSTFLQSQFDYYEEVYLRKLPADSAYKISFDHADSIRYLNTIENHGNAGYLQRTLLTRAESELSTITGVDQITANQNGLNSSQNQLNQYKSSFNRYRDQKNMKSNLKELSSSKLITQNKSLDAAHKSIANLKRKYLTLPSTNDLSTGQKRNSLKNQPLSKRIVFGGSIKVSQSESIDIDFSPSMAYLITKRLSSGIEIVYRGEFGDGKKWHESFSTNTYGGRLFTDYAVLKSFYAHTELESISTPKQSTTPADINSNEIVFGAMVGMGKRFGLGKSATGKVVIQYNFLHKENALYSSPWVVRFGVEFKKKKK